MEWQGGCLQVEDLPGVSEGKVSAYNVGDLGLIPGLRRLQIDREHIDVLKKEERREYLKSWIILLYLR